MTRITSLDQYKNHIDSIKQKYNYDWSNIHLLYRGHSLDSYEIIPTIARGSLTTSEILNLETRLLAGLKKQISGDQLGSVKLHLPTINNGYLDDWYLQFQARHLEIPSRLIDWSMNEFTALFFVLMNFNHFGIDGHVWVYPSIINPSNAIGDPNLVGRLINEYLHLNAGENHKNTLSMINPLNPDKITVVHNSYIIDKWSSQIGERRRVSQHGKFIVKPNNQILSPLNKNFIGQFMEKIIIDGTSKESIYNELLNQYNFNEERILPPIPKDTQDIIDKIIHEAKLGFKK